MTEWITEPRTNRIGFRVRLFLIIVGLLCLCGRSALAQDKIGRAPGKSQFVNVEGKVRCDKAGPEYAIEVPDRPGHALLLAKRLCHWTEPLVIKGAKTKDGVWVTFSEKMEGKLHVHGFEVDTLDSGEQLTWQTMGQVMAERGPAPVKGRWSLMRGDGKFKAIKGGGSYEGRLGVDDVLTLDFEGVYDLSEVAHKEDKEKEQEKAKN